jgi:hypothetical protein
MKRIPDEYKNILIWNISSYILLITFFTKNK